MSEVLLVPDELILKKIYVIRKNKVMLDSDLAEFYGVETRVLNQAVKRNLSRFPSDFMFQLSESEFEELKNTETGWGGRRKMPMAFSEHGILMLSSVLNSAMAVSVSQQIIRLFISLRDVVLANNEFVNNLRDIKEKLIRHDQSLEMIHEYLFQFIEKQETLRQKIGYTAEKT